MHSQELAVAAWNEATARTDSRRAYGFALVLLLVALGVAFAPTSASAQFSEWASFNLPDPFSVTGAVRGLSATIETAQGPVPQVRLEAVAGYFSGVQNQFEYHSSAALSAPETGNPRVRVVDTRGPIAFSSAGVQSALDGLCCSNNAIGLDDNRSIHVFTDFGAGESWEVIIGTPEAAKAPPIRVKRLPLPDADRKEER